MKKVEDFLNDRMAGILHFLIAVEILALIVICSIAMYKIANY